MSTKALWESYSLAASAVNHHHHIPRSLIFRSSIHPLNWSRHDICMWLHRSLQLQSFIIKHSTCTAAGLATLGHSQISLVILSQKHFFGTYNEDQQESSHFWQNPFERLSSVNVLYMLSHSVHAGVKGRTLGCGHPMVSHSCGAVPHHHVMWMTRNQHCLWVHRGAELGHLCIGPADRGCIHISPVHPLNPQHIIALWSFQVGVPCLHRIVHVRSMHALQPWNTQTTLSQVLL